MVAIGDRKPPWEWDTSNPLGRILSGCCVSLQENRLSIDSVLKALNLEVRAFTHA